MLKLRHPIGTGFPALSAVLFVPNVTAFFAVNENCAIFVFLEDSLVGTGIQTNRILTVQTR